MTMTSKYGALIHQQTHSNTNDKIWMTKIFNLETYGHDDDAQVWGLKNPPPVWLGSMGVLVCVWCLRALNNRMAR